jgi:FtsP/CotA-like multicopper oxidase with cupredoxin domain
MHRTGAGIGLALLAMAIPVSSAPTTMSHAEQVEMYAAAGFVISADGKNPLNICQQVVHPAVALFDPKGDGKPEAVFIDAGACYKTDGKSVSIVTKRSDGRWQGMLSREGVLKPGTARTGGWLDVVVIHSGKPETYVHAAVTAPAAAGIGNVVIDSYDPATTLATRANIERAGNTRMLTAATGGYPTDGRKLPKSVASLTPAEIAALYKAAGFKRFGAAWKGCDGQSDAFLFDDHDQMDTSKNPWFLTA